MTLCFSVYTPSAAHADITLDKNGRVFAYGDLRLRLESDFDGETRSKQEVEDRTRARTRARIGLQYKPDNVLTFDTRIRTGSNDSHQSPHNTIHDFDGNPRGNVDVNFDKWYVGAKEYSLWGWAGRNGFPFWSQDEVFWDEDATLVGISGGIVQPVESIGTFSASAGYFALPVGMRDFNGNLAAGELNYAKTIDNVTLSLGGGVLSFLPDRDDSNAGRLLNGNGFREYLIWISNAKAKWTIKAVPLLAEIDWLHNGEHYYANDLDPFTAQNRDQRNGYVLSVKAGNLDTQGSWMAAYYYAYVETFAVNASYAQDEWVRWGSGGETRGSDMKGHQFNMGYAVSDNMNVLARLYIVEAITSVERGSRFRMDVNYKF